jgi:glycosyltransferase involved in cell wall biosynthesis
VVQNHSTDRTGEEIEKIAKHDTRVIQIIPEQKDLGIGGCWNLAVNSPQCGRYVCQLDSDDIYEGGDALYIIVETLREGKYGMVSGTYRVVNFNLEEIPPGVVDHREWSDGNGRNNLLRVHGIGAPRAFPTVLLRQYPFPNVSYGEDYAVALRISRDFRVGRIFKPLYLCRRWEENTDADLTHLEANRLAFYKDKLRTEEILERQKINNASDS